VLVGDGERVFFRCISLCVVRERGGQEARGVNIGVINSEVALLYTSLGARGRVELSRREVVAYVGDKTPCAYRRRCGCSTTSVDIRERTVGRRVSVDGDREAGRRRGEIRGCVAMFCVTRCHPSLI
jgi:hypothetical protein